LTRPSFRGARERKPQYMDTATVIASEAKQSSPSRYASSVLDCFVGFAFSQGRKI
jgi:hypothetical protein